MFDTIGGIPMHPLIVHGVVVLVPLAALLVLLAALSPRVRGWAGILTPIVATLALVMVPFATQSGEALEERVGDPAYDHAELTGVAAAHVGYELLSVMSANRG